MEVWLAEVEMETRQSGETSGESKGRDEGIFSLRWRKWEPLQRKPCPNGRDRSECWVLRAVAIKVSTDIVG